MDPIIKLKIEELKKRAKEENWNPLPLKRRRKTELERMVTTKEQAEFLMWQLNKK